MEADPSIGPIILTGLNLPWEKALHLGNPVNFSARQVIVQNMQDLESGFYYVRRGLVRLSYIAPNGHQRVLFYVGRGTFFYDVPALVPSNCVFTCMENTGAVFFRKKMLTNAFASQYPDLMINWVEATAKKSSSFFRQLCSLGIYDTFVNVCRLLYCMELYQKEDGKVVPHLTQQDLAALLSVHRGSLHKALTRLKQEGIIGNYSRNSLEIYDVERLRQYIFEKH